MINFTNESGEDPKIPSKKNHGRDYWEIHGENTRHS
jgi:hypothetical protein